MKPPQIAMALIAAGCVCGLISLVFPSIVGGRMAYSEEDAIEYQQASLDLHNSLAGQVHEDASDSEDDTHDHDGHEHPVTDAADVQAAQERMAAIEAKRDTALTRGQSTAAVFKWLAVIVGGAGIVTHFATRNSVA